LILRSLVAALLVAAPAAAATKAPVRPAAAKVDWTKTYAVTLEGGFVRGNPRARIKLIEYASLTCPHCRVFHEAAMKTLLGTYVASGNLSYEYRSFVLNGPDYAAALVARCSSDPRTFFSAVNSFYLDQSVWTQPFAELGEAENKRIQALPEDQRVAAVAVAGKLDGYATKLGMARPRFDACIANKAQADKLLAMRKSAVETYKITGTPGFLINGVYQADVFDWAKLEPLLQAAMKP
jgi:protein-disulfide isomerase